LGRRKQCATETQTKSNELRSGGVTQAGISSDLDQFEEPTADPEAPEPGSPQPGQPGQTPGGQTPGGTVAADRYKD